ncbi:MAG: Clp protease N-terminal domain-containing protein [Gaiellaceae bacterium]
MAHNALGTEHLLLGLVADEESAASRVLGEIGTTPAGVRDEVLRLLRGEGRE